jgi:replication factor C large subunit
VLIVNDYYALTRRASALRSLALEIKFQGIRSPSIEKALRAVAAAEGIDVPPTVFKKIAEEAAGDLRAAVNDFEAAAAGRKAVPAEAAERIGGRDERTTAYAMVGEVLHTLDLAAARKAVWTLDEEPSFAMLWIEENVPVEYRHPEDLDRAFYYLSRADQMLGRTVRRQAFGLWGYATDFMSGGVALAKRERTHGWNRYSFPTWLSAMSRSKAARQRRAQTFGRLGAYFHTSKREVASSIAPYLPKLMDSDFDLAVAVTAGAGLGADDLADLLDKDEDAKEVQTIYAEARRLLESGVSLGVAAESKRGARKGSLSLAEAVEAAKAAEAVKKPPARGKKAKEEAAKTEPAPPPPPKDEDLAEKDEGPAEPDPSRNKSLFDF